MVTLYLLLSAISHWGIKIHVSTPPVHALYVVHERFIMHLCACECVYTVACRQMVRVLLRAETENVGQPCFFLA